MKTLWLFCLALASTGAAETKDYQLFVGADIDVNYQGSLVRVIGVDRDSFIVEGAAGRQEIQMNSGGRLRVTPVMKLARTLATVDKLLVERAYTPANDPGRKFYRENEAFMAQEDNASLAQGIADTARLPSTAQLSAMPAAAVAAAVKSFTSGEQQEAAAQAFESADIANEGVRAGQMQDELARQDYDALHFSFEVVADHPLVAPYLVATASYRETGRKDGPAHSWIYAEELKPIDASRHRVEVLAGGLPPGFTFDRFRLHVYDRGAEVATTVSTNWLPMTQDEAFMYIVANFLGSHRADTMPAAVVMRFPSHKECAAMLSAGAPPALFVKVGKDGMPAGAFLDSACTKPSPEGVISATIGQLRFTPALDHGRPVDGVARISLST